MLRCTVLLTRGILLALASMAGAAQLRVQPEKLDLAGRDPVHGVIVTLVGDDGKTADVTRRVIYNTTAPQTASVDAKGMVTALADGQTELTVQMDALTARVPVQVTAFADRPAPSFKQDVLPVLTRSGCNMGGCHGKLAGQNGFRLSLRGFAPEWDYEWLTREVNGRRIDFAFPESSLLLQKPCGDLPHEGGVRFRPDSRAWRTLRAKSPSCCARSASARSSGGTRVPGGRVSWSSAPAVPRPARATKRAKSLASMSG